MKCDKCGATVTKSMESCAECGAPMVQKAKVRRPATRRAAAGKKPAPRASAQRGRRSGTRASV